MRTLATSESLVKPPRRKRERGASTREALALLQWCSNPRLPDRALLALLQ